MSRPFASKVEECVNCPLHRNPFIPPQVVSKSKILIVGEQPKDTELELGEVFVGQSGKMLNYLCEQAGLNRFRLYVTNAVKCYDTEKASNESLQICGQAFLKREIEFLKPEVIIAMGDYALRSLTGYSKISAFRGTPRRIKIGSVSSVLIPTFHPAYGLRNRRLLPTIISDLRLARTMVEKPDPAPVGNWFSFQILNTTRLIKEKLKKILLSSAKYVAIDLETDSLDPLTANILMIGISQSSQFGYAIPLVKPQFDLQMLETYLTQILKEKICIFHNAKFDLHLLRRFLPRLSMQKIKFHDTLAMAYLMNEESDHDLEACIAIYTDIGNAYKHKVLGQYYQSLKKAATIPEQVLAKYCVADTCATLRLFEILKHSLDKDLKNYYNNIVRPLLITLLEMEVSGMRVDVPYLKKLMKQWETDRSLAQKRMRKLVGMKDLNANSPKQLLEAFKRLRIDLEVTDALTVSEKMKTLRLKSPEYEFLSALLDFRANAKSYGIGKGILERLDKKHYIHTTYLATGTVTGRLSSRNPNLQNIDRSSEWRNIFIAPKSYSLVSADYKQVELKLLAWVSQDHKMMADFESGRDIHSEWAGRFFGNEYARSQKENPELASAMRSFAKSWNFAIPYGGDPSSIFSRLKAAFGDDSLIHVDMEMVERYLAQYLDNYKSLKKWLKHFPSQAEKMKILTTPFGNKRRLFVTPVTSQQELGHRYRQALNFLPQSIASSITNSSLILVDRELRERGFNAFPIMQVHDQIVFYAHKSCLKEVVSLIKRICERTIPELGKKFTVEIKIGKALGDLKEVIERR